MLKKPSEYRLFSYRCKTFCKLNNQILLEEECHCQTKPYSAPYCISASTLPLLSLSSSAPYENKTVLTNREIRSTYEYQNHSEIPRELNASPTRCQIRILTFLNNFLSIPNASEFKEKNEGLSSLSDYLNILESNT